VLRSWKRSRTVTGKVKNDWQEVKGQVNTSKMIYYIPVHWIPPYYIAYTSHWSWLIQNILIFLNCFKIKNVILWQLRVILSSWVVRYYDQWLWRLKGNHLLQYWITIIFWQFLSLSAVHSANCADTNFVRLSVYLSVMFQYSVKTAKHIEEILLLLWSDHLIMLQELSHVL